MSLDQIWHSSLHIQTLMEYQKQSKQTYVFLNASSPKDGKLSKPQESPTPLKNHLKQFQKKLMLKYFPRHLTCLLQPRKQKLGWSVFSTTYVPSCTWNPYVPCLTFPLALPLHEGLILKSWYCHLSCWMWK